jgi:hypothetical protein
MTRFSPRAASISTPLSGTCIENTHLVSPTVLNNIPITNPAVCSAGYRLHRLQYQGSFTSETLALQVISLASAARPETLWVIVQTSILAIISSRSIIVAMSRAATQHACQDQPSKLNLSELVCAEAFAPFWSLWTGGIHVHFAYRGIPASCTGHSSLMSELRRDSSCRSVFARRSAMNKSLRQSSSHRCQKCTTEMLENPSD